MKWNKFLLIQSDRFYRKARRSSAKPVSRYEVIYYSSNRKNITSRLVEA